VLSVLGRIDADRRGVAQTVRAEFGSLLDGANLSVGILPYLAPVDADQGAARRSEKKLSDLHPRVDPRAS
jgi:hypothetical protein